MDIKHNTWASYIFKYRKPIVLSALFNLGYSIFTLVSIPLIIPFFQLLFNTQSSIDENSSALEVFMYQNFQSLIEENGANYALIKVCIAFVIVIVLRNIFRYLSLYVMAPVRNGIVADIRKSLYRKIFNLPISYYTEESKGDLISKSIADVQEVEWSILNVIEAVFRSPILLLGALILMIYISPQLTLYVFALVIVTVVLLRLSSKSLRSISHKAQTYLGRLTAIIEESINGVRVIKSFNAEQESIKRFEKANLNYKNTLTQTLRIKDISAPFSETLGMIIVGILMYLGARLVFNDTLDPASFFAFLFAFYQVIEPSKALSNGYFNIQKGMAAVDRINSVLAIDNDIIEPQNAPIWQEFQNQIQFEGVHFTYNNSNRQTLTDLNFSIQKGQKVALVGPSGSGKTTIINLLCKFHNPTNGKIIVDELPLSEIPTSQWRNKIGMVTQDAILFNDTIKYNLTLGKTQITKAQIREALCTANADEFVDQMEFGIDTIIGDNGIRLSGGQKQRLAIARAVLMQPELLIFDEATSSMDTQSEKLVQDAIDRLSKNKTSIIIAHRLSTIVNSDVILLIQNGKIEASGDHKTLMASNLLYKELIEHQFI